MVENKRERWKKKFRRIGEEVLLKRERTPPKLNLAHVFIEKSSEFGIGFNFILRFD